MFAELIDKIVVYEAEGVGKARTQKVDIYFNYVGQVDIAYTEEELAEIKAQEEQIEAERLAKQREREKSLPREAKGEKLAENGGEIVKTKVCPHCQKEFIPTSNRQIFCSKDCCYQARQDKTKSRQRSRKGNHYYRQRVCAVCGSTYWPTHSQQKLCSEECQKQNHNEKSLEFYHKKQKEKSKCNDLSQMKEPGIQYELIGDYYYPCLTIENEEPPCLTKYGRMRERYLREHKKVFIFQSAYKWKVI